MRVLVTRTWDDSIATAKALAVLGHEAVIAPLRERIMLDNPLPEGPFDAVLATSRHAFSSLPDVLQGLPCFGVGEKTAAAARDSGFQQAQALGGDGAALAKALLARFKPGSRMLYLAGQPRHDALEKALTSGGIKLVIAERYAMTSVETLPETARTALAGGQIDVVLHYSHESAQTYLDLAERAGLGKAAATPLQLCLSQAIASIFGANVRVRIAGTAKEAALLERLRS